MEYQPRKYIQWTPGKIVFHEGDPFRLYLPVTNYVDGDGEFTQMVLDIVHIPPNYSHNKQVQHIEIEYGDKVYTMMPNRELLIPLRPELELTRY